MKKHLLALIGGAILFGAPALAFADLTPLQAQIQQLTVVAAALKAQQVALDGRPVACAALVSKTHVALDEPFILAWGSVGAMSPGDDPARSVMTPNGSALIRIQKVGGWRYSFTFYSKSGESTKCSVDIFVS